MAVAGHEGRGRIDALRAQDVPARGAFVMSVVTPAESCRCANPAGACGRTAGLASLLRRHANRREGGAVRRVHGPCTPLPAQARSTFNGLNCHEGRLPDLGGRISDGATTPVGTSSLTERRTTGAP